MQMPGEITPPTIGSYRTLSRDSDAYTDVVIWVERLTIQAYSSVPFYKSRSEQYYCYWRLFNIRRR
jgi:hypothetical protein